MAYATVEQLFRHQNILRAYSRIGGPGTVFQDFYNLGPSAVGNRTQTDNFAADIFDHSRLLAHGRAPEAGPGTVKRKPAGQFRGTLMRLHEKMPIRDAEIWNYRPVGSPVGTLDSGGQKWLALQTRYLLQRNRNAREFCVNRMFRNGFSMKSEGDDLILGELSAGDFNIDFQIPAGNLTTVGGIFGSDSWDTSTTDIVQQFLELGKLSERQSGLSPAVAWINSSAYSRMISNTKIAGFHGTARRVFDLQTKRQINTIPSGSRSSGYLVKFDTMPQIDFIVYDGVLEVGKYVDTQAANDSSLFIPDGKMIVTPAPSLGDWLDIAVGGEPVRQHKADLSPSWKWGFYTWVEPMTQPSGRELIVVDKFMPYLSIPKAVYYIDIYTP